MEDRFALLGFDEASSTAAVEFSERYYGLDDAAKFEFLREAIIRLADEIRRINPAAV